MQTIASQVPSNYQGTYKSRLQEAQALLKAVTDENNRIYLEPIVKEENLKKPEAQSFVKFDMSIIDSLSQTSPLDEKMRHIVPP